jgi:hypothetical protein
MVSSEHEFPKNSFLNFLIFVACSNIRAKSIFSLRAMKAEKGPVVGFGSVSVKCAIDFGKVCSRGLHLKSSRIVHDVPLDPNMYTPVR